MGSSDSIIEAARARHGFQEHCKLSQHFRAANSIVTAVQSTADGINMIM